MEFIPKFIQLRYAYFNSPLQIHMFTRVPIYVQQTSSYSQQWNYYIKSYSTCTNRIRAHLPTPNM